jgi:hypothetical protein
MTVLIDILRFAVLSSAAALIADALHRLLAYLRRLIGRTSVSAGGVDACGLAGADVRKQAQANVGSCTSESQITEATVSVEEGSNLYTVTGGKVYLTGPYEGAPFGLSVPLPAKASPFDLGNIILRAAIYICSHAAQLSLTSKAFPTIIDGIPLQINHVNKNINGVGGPPFTFNPTNCTPMAVTG